MELPTGYSFVVAANLFRNYGGLVMYIKYVKNDPAKGIWIRDAGKNHIWYSMPSREVVMVRDAFDNEAFRPNESFDVCLDFNTFRDEFGPSVGLKYFMTNFSHDGVFDIHREVVPEEKKQVQLLSDSGGLQLARGTTGLIHPKDLVEFYNKNCDAGMILDMPLWVQDEKLAIRAARLQKKNNEIMLQNSRPGLELINIFHGYSVNDRRKYRDIVEDERIPRVAIGGLLRQKPVTCVNTVYDLILGSSYRYRQYHALGVFSTSYLALLVKIANSGDNPPHITSDSTSHIQASLSNVYHFHLGDDHIMSRRPLGTRAGSIANPSLHLLCNCPICSSLKHRDVFAFGHNRFNGFMAIHNAIEMGKYTQSLQEACRSLTPSQYNKYMMTQLKNTQDKADVKLALDYIDVVTQEGLKKAQKKYERHLNNWRTTEDKPTSLFDENPSESGKEVYDKTVATLESLEAQLKG